MKYRNLYIFLNLLVVLIITSGCNNEFEINVDTTGKLLNEENKFESTYRFSVMINGEKVGIEVMKKGYKCLIWEAFQNKDRDRLALSISSRPVKINIKGARIPNFIPSPSYRHILLFHGKKLIYSREIEKEVFVIQGWNKNGELEVAAGDNSFAINKWGREVKK